MDGTIRQGLSSDSLSLYWGLVKDLNNSQKLELVTMLIDSVRQHPQPMDDIQERERTFRSLAGCWADDEGDDDVESIIIDGREKRKGQRFVPSLDS